MSHVMSRDGSPRHFGRALQCPRSPSAPAARAAPISVDVSVCTMARIPSPVSAPVDSSAPAILFACSILIMPRGSVKRSPSCSVWLRQDGLIASRRASSACRSLRRSRRSRRCSPAHILCLTTMEPTQFAKKAFANLQFYIGRAVVLGRPLPAYQSRAQTERSGRRPSGRLPMATNVLELPRFDRTPLRLWDKPCLPLRSRADLAPVAAR